MKRSCQRQALVFDLPVQRMLEFVPTPAGAEKNDGRAPHAFLGGVAVTDNHHQAVTVLRGQADVNSAADPAKLPRLQNIENLMEGSNINFYH